MSINLGKIQNGKPYKPYLFLFLIISILLVIGVVYVTFSKVKITLFPKKDSTIVEYSISVSENAENNSQNMRGRLLEKKFTITDEFSEVEKKEVDAYAKGVVTLYNKRDFDQAFVPKTQLQSDNGLIYRTTDWVNIPAQGQANINIVADQKGEKYNTGPTKFKIVKIWSGLSSVLFGENKESIGGGKILDYVVTSQILKKAEEKAIEKIKEKALREFENALNKNESINPDTISVETVSFKPDAKEDDIKKSFNYTFEANAFAITLDQEHVKKTALIKGEKTIQEKKDIKNLPEKNINYTIKSVDKKNKSSILDIKAEIETVNVIPEKALSKTETAGKKYGDLVAHYKQFEEIDHIEVFFSPFWVSKVPTNMGNVEIIVE